MKYSALASFRSKSFLIPAHHSVTAREVMGRAQDTRTQECDERDATPSVPVPRQHHSVLRLAAGYQQVGVTVRHKLCMGHRGTGGTHCAVRQHWFTRGWRQSESKTCNSSLRAYLCRILVFPRRSTQQHTENTREAIEHMHGTNSQNANTTPVKFVDTQPWYACTKRRLRRTMQPFPD